MDFPLGGVYFHIRFISCPVSTRLVAQRTDVGAFSHETSPKRHWQRTHERQPAPTTRAQGFTVRATVSTYAWRAVSAAALIPAGTLLWFWATYDFVNPDGSPDNAVIHGLPALAILACFLWSTALLAFHILGRVQRRRPRPSLGLGLGFALATSVMLASAFYYVAVSSIPSDPMPGAAMTAAGLFVFSWVSLTFGAMTQLRCIRSARALEEGGSSSR